MYIVIAHDGSRARPLLLESGYFAEYGTIKECEDAIRLHPFRVLECWAIDTNNLADGASLLITGDEDD